MGGLFKKRKEADTTPSDQDARLPKLQDGTVTKGTKPYKTSKTNSSTLTIPQKPEITPGPPTELGTPGAAGTGNESIPHGQGSSFGVLQETELAARDSRTSSRETGRVSSAAISSIPPGAGLTQSTSYTSLEAPFDKPSKVIPPDGTSIVLAEGLERTKIEISLPAAEMSRHSRPDMPMSRQQQRRMSHMPIPPFYRPTPVRVEYYDDRQWCLPQLQPTPSNYEFYGVQGHMTPRSSYQGPYSYPDFTTSRPYNRGPIPRRSMPVIGESFPPTRSSTPGPYRNISRDSPFPGNPRISGCDPYDVRDPFVSAPGSNKDIKYMTCVMIQNCKNQAMLHDAVRAFNREIRSRERFVPPEWAEVISNLCRLDDTEEIRWPVAYWDELLAEAEQEDWIPQSFYPKPYAPDVSQQASLTSNEDRLSDPAESSTPTIPRPRLTSRIKMKDSETHDEVTTEHAGAVAVRKVQRKAKATKR